MVEHQQRRTRGDRRLVRRAEVAAAHQPRQLALRQAAVIVALGDDSAMTHDSDARRNLDDFAELVRDEDDRHAARGHGAQRPEKPIGLARGQRRGRFIEDQDAGAAHQRLGDLDPLLLADRQIGDHSVRVEVDVEVAPDGGKALDHRLSRQATVRPGAADQQVLGDRVALHEFEMLVDHADAERQGIGRIADLHRLAIDLDDALVGGIGAEEHVHQAGLAGTVLTEQAEDVARMQRQVDTAHRLNRAKALGDAAHGDKGSRCHV